MADSNIFDKWVTSTDEEYWSPSEYYDTKEEAIKRAAADLDLSDGDTFLIGKTSRANVENAGARDIIEIIIERTLEDILPDIGENWAASVLNDVNLCKSVQEKLNEISALIEQEKPPGFFIVRNAEQRTVGEEC